MFQLMVEIYEKAISPEDVARFIAIQYIMDQAGIKVVDLDPGIDDVEVRWPHGQEWLSFDEACTYIARELEKKGGSLE